MNLHPGSSDLCTNFHHLKGKKEFGQRYFGPFTNSLMTKRSTSGASLYESSPSDVCTNSHHVKGKKECGQRYFIFFLDNWVTWFILLFFFVVIFTYLKERVREGMKVGGKKGKGRKI